MTSPTIISPCPDCKSLATVCRTRDCGNGRKLHYLMCHDCKTEGSFGKDFDQAKKRWNEMSMPIKEDEPIMPMKEHPKDIVNLARVDWDEVFLNFIYRLALNDGAAGISKSDIADYLSKVNDVRKYWFTAFENESHWPGLGVKKLQYGNQAIIQQVIFDNYDMLYGLANVLQYNLAQFITAIEDDAHGEEDI